MNWHNLYGNLRRFSNLNEAFEIMLPCLSSIHSIKRHFLKLLSLTRNNLCKSIHFNLELSVARKYKSPLLIASSSIHTSTSCPVSPNINGELTWERHSSKYLMLDSELFSKKGYAYKDMRNNKQPK